jgi:hypothetical protein
VYGFDTYDHATCVHFHHPLDMKLWTYLQLVSTMIPIGTTSCATKLPLYIVFFLWLVFNYCIIDIPLHCKSQYHIGIHTHQTIKFHGRWKFIFELKLKAIYIFHQTLNKGIHMDVFIYLDVFCSNSCLLFNIS